MDNGGPRSSCGRTELVAALDNLCTAMDHLVRAAEFKLGPSARSQSNRPATIRLDFPMPFESPQDLGADMECFNSLVPTIHEEKPDLGVQPVVEDPDVIAPVRASVEGVAFAGRLVVLQRRLGGFLK